MCSADRQVWGRQLSSLKLQRAWIKQKVLTPGMDIIKHGCLEHGRWTVYALGMGEADCQSYRSAPLGNLLKKNQTTLVKMGQG